MVLDLSDLLRTKTKVLLDPRRIFETDARDPEMPAMLMSMIADPVRRANKEAVRTGGANGLASRLLQNQPARVGGWRLRTLASIIATQQQRLTVHRHTAAARRRNESTCIIRHSHELFSTSMHSQ